MNKRLFTLVFVRDPTNRKVLLGFKKRGFGKFKWNGLGGKANSNETLVEAAKRLVKKCMDLKIKFFSI